VFTGSKRKRIQRRGREGEREIETNRDEAIETETKT
jgi:hypothetical protein